MKTPPVSSVYNQQTGRESASERQGIFRTGRIVEAVTLTGSRDNHVMLRIGNSELKAVTNLALPKNKRLTFRVVQVVPHVLLKFVPPSDATTGRNPLNDAMLKQLPLQNSLAPLLSALTSPAILTDTSRGMTELRPLVIALISSLPARQDALTADSLRQAILQSGLFLEARLAAAVNSNAIDIPMDLKTLLLRLLQSLEKLSPESGLNPRVSNGSEIHQKDVDLPPPHKQQGSGQPRITLNAETSDAGHIIDINTLYKKAQGALARLILQQIVTAENVDTEQHLWRLELPLRHQDDVDIVSMTIKREHASGEQDETQSWFIDLAIDLPMLGPINIRTSLIQQGVSSTFWCDAPLTRTLIDSKLSRLKSRLDELGIKTLKLSCQDGSPPAAEREDLKFALVDQHA